MDLTFNIGGVHVKPSSSVSNGVFFDLTLSVTSHISSVVKLFFYIFVILQVFDLLSL